MNTEEKNLPENDSRAHIDYINRLLKKERMSIVDNLTRAERESRNMDIDLEYKDSGKTLREIIEGYRYELSEWQKEYDFFNSLLGDKYLKLDRAEIEEILKKWRGASLIPNVIENIMKDMDLKIKGKLEGYLKYC